MILEIQINFFIILFNFFDDYFHSDLRILSRKFEV